MSNAPRRIPRASRVPPAGGIRAARDRESVLHSPRHAESRPEGCQRGAGEKVCVCGIASVQNIPFIKRAGFSAEKEFRIVHFSNDDKDAHHLPFDPSIISEIIRLNKNAKTKDFSSTKKVVHSKKSTIISKNT